MIGVEQADTVAVPSRLMWVLAPLTILGAMVALFELADLWEGLCRWVLLRRRREW